MCQHERTLEVTAKCSDLCFVKYNVPRHRSMDGGLEHDGYVPTNIGFGDDSDYVSLTLCVDCGTVISDIFPISDAKIRKEFRKYTP